MKLRHITWTSATIVALLAVLVVGEDTNAEDEQMQPVSEPPIKLVHVLNPGEKEYLSPNLIGVQNIAMTFLPLTLNFVNIIDAFREIVNGVRYEIILNAVDTKVEKKDEMDIVCRLVILEKPWLTTQWGDKVRELVTSNCTSETDNLTDPAERVEVLNDKYARNAIFNGGTRKELDDSAMADLEAQIVSMPISSSISRRSTVAPVSSSYTSTSTTTTTPVPEPETTAQAEIQTTVSEQQLTEPTTETVVTEQETTPLSILNDTEMKFLDNLFSVGALSFEQSRKESQSKNDASNEPNYFIEQQQPFEQQLLEQVQQQQEEDLGQQQEDQQRQVSLTENEAYYQVDQDQQQQQSEQQDFQQPLQEQLQFTMHHARAKRGNNDIVGGLTKLDNTEAQKRLQSSLDKLATGGSSSYKIAKVHSASVQVVAGTLTLIDCDLIDAEGKEERCQVEIWSRPWLPKDNTEVTIDCPGKGATMKRHSRAANFYEYAEKKTHKKHDHHNLGKVEHLFNKFQVKFNRRYANSMERQMRLRIFKQNLKIIHDLNQHEQGSAKYGITEFTDMTSTEYKQRAGLWQRDPEKAKESKQADIPAIELPKEFDWREKGVVSKVKNQGNCGSCWAFSVVGNIEGLHAVKSGKLEEFSEQELLDCDTLDNACGGGLFDNAYDALEKIGGLELETEYPYIARKDQCHFNKSMIHAKVTSHIDLPKNETAIAQWLIANGPISVGINANAMQFYRGGVSHPWHALCSAKSLDHGVLIVGFGVSEYPTFKKTLPYWIIKNSWGPKWGEQGYYRVYRGDNTCGVSEMASSAILANE